MSISSLYLLDLLGKPLMSRRYRGYGDHETIYKFILHVMDKEEENQLTPVLEVDDISFAFIKHNNLYFVATTNRNSNISLVFVFLHQLLQVMSDYLNEVREESIRDNFVVIHELLDETMDFGYPQTTESRILMEYITQEGKKLNDVRKVPSAVTNAVSWRPEGIRYKKNELFMDIIESVDLMANANGTVVRSEVIGSIRMRSRLSGMPELRLGLNDKLLQEDESEDSKYVDLDEVKFHQCVRLSRFQSDRSIFFIPPDGEFQLLSYRFNSYVKPPLWVDCVREVYPYSKVEYRVKVTSRFMGRYTASDVEIIIPVPEDVDSGVFNAPTGVVSYLPESNVIKWNFKSLPGSKEFSLNAKFGLPSVSSEEKECLPPIQVRFEIAFYNISGIKVQYLKVTEKSGYTALPWIRYVTQNGDYQIRIKEVLHRNRVVKSKECGRNRKNRS